MSTFLALYRGQLASASKLLVLIAEPAILVDFAARKLSTPSNLESDAVLHGLEQGRWRALQLVKNEARG